MTKKNETLVLETAYITSNKTFCDGGIGPLGHPRVYLTVDKDKSQVECPYCDKCFIKKVK